MCNNPIPGKPSDSVLITSDVDVEFVRVVHVETGFVAWIDTASIDASNAIKEKPWLTPVPTKIGVEHCSLYNSFEPCWNRKVMKAFWQQQYQHEQQNIEYFNAIIILQH